MNRKIPSTLASQHPDNAGKAYWLKKEFISTRKESHECFLSFSELKIEEYKWDWEGKFVDESVIERLYGEYFEYFKKNPLGKKKFLTFRLPNPKVETEFRMGRAFMGILSAASLAKQVGFTHPPLMEVILPMTETAEEMIDIQEAFSEIASLKHNLYNLNNVDLKHIEIIPLFEQVSIITSSSTILKKYISLHRKKFGFLPTYMRPYLARSDPALNAGLIPTVLAIKIALSDYRMFEKETGIKLYPIIGSASLPFRGGLTPHTVADFCKEYRGIKTALLQSAFRYDYEKPDVIRAIKKLNAFLPKHKAQLIPTSDRKKLMEIIPIFESLYQPTIEKLAPLINKVASFLPKRRERVLHIGLFGYSRGLGKIKLPRAIGFTGALYSLGIPPEIIGTGRALAVLKKLKMLKLVEKYYVGIRKELTRAGRYIYKDGIIKMAAQSVVGKELWEDVSAIEAYLGHTLGPHTEDEVKHTAISAIIHNQINTPKISQKHLHTQALLRKSLG